MKTKNPVIAMEAQSRMELPVEAGIAVFIRAFRILVSSRYDKHLIISKYLIECSSYASANAENHFLYNTFGPERSILSTYSISKLILTIIK